VSALHTALYVIGVITIAYFAVVNGMYLVFTVIAWRSLSSHLRGRTYSAVEEAFDSPFTPGITVILPAYNEAAGIVESVYSLLALRYPSYEVVVVNDGSTDDTLARLTAAFDLVPAHRAVRTSIPTQTIKASHVSRRSPSVWVLDKENGGKADALNAGVAAAQYPYVCCLDADALIEPDALLRVAAPILDDPERVVATGGIVRIANGSTIDHGRVTGVRLPSNPLAVLQVLEYFRAFLIGRVGWTKLNALLIISGAFGLFQRQAVEEVGGYSTNTVGEDMELVVRLHRHYRARRAPYRIEFVADPVCWTEVPEDLGSLSRQRRRWHRGLGQTLWRHRDSVGNPRYGAFGLLAMPYFLLLEFLGPVVETIGVGLTIVAFAVGDLSWTSFLSFLVLAFLVGILLSIAALALEEFNFRRHPRTRDIVRLVFYTVLENLGYRQLNDLWRMLAFVDLARRKQGWGAQKRRGIGNLAGGGAQAPAQQPATETLTKSQ
jgi:cellulose synthase/poly-beta-1,6-N-acetylglucosamine synthase-like glycosyltransferase